MVLITDLPPVGVESAKIVETVILYRPLDIPPNRLAKYKNQISV